MSSAVAQEQTAPNDGSAAIEPVGAEIVSEPITPSAAAVETAAPEVVVEAPAEPTEAAEPAKPAEPVAPASAAAAEPAAPETAAEPVAPVYQDFAFPEGITAQPEQITALTGILGKYNLTQEAGQELVDLHASTFQAWTDQATEKMAQAQRDAFEETRAGWRKDVDKRFGNRRDTVLNDAKWALGELMPDAKKRSELHQMLAFTGAGDHPAMIELLSAATKKMRERTAPARGLPPKNAPASPADRRYGARPST